MIILLACVYQIITQFLCQMIFDERNVRIFFWYVKSAFLGPVIFPIWVALERFVAEEGHRRWTPQSGDVNTLAIRITFRCNELVGATGIYLNQYIYRWTLNILSYKCNNGNPVPANSNAKLMDWHPNRTSPMTL